MKGVILNMNFNQLPLKNVSLIKTILFFVLGLFMVLAPQLVFNSLISILITYFLIQALFKFYQGFRLKQQGVAVSSAYRQGSFYLILALLTSFLAKSIVSFLPFIIGILIIISGFQQYKGPSTTLKEVNPRYRFSTKLTSGLLILAGLFIMLNPFKSLLILFRLLGALFIFIACTNAITFIKSDKLS